MNNQEYWRNRWLRTSIELDRRNIPRIADLEEKFNTVRNSIQKDLKGFYARYARNDEISEQEAEELLTNVEQETWRMELSEFREKAIEGGWEQDLNREYFRSRVTRLKMLERQVSMHLYELAYEQDKSLEAIMFDEFEENYMRSIYELHSQQGKILSGRVETNFAKYNEREIELILKRPWFDRNFSDSVWNNNTKWLPDQLEKTLLEGFVNGDPLEVMVDKFTKRFDVAKNRAVTLLQSESKHIKVSADMQAMKENGVSRYRFLATLEIGTCSECGLLDNETFPLADAVPGENAPLIHANCRCAITPEIEESLRSNTRWASDPITGARRRIPRVSYSEWRQQVIDEVGTGGWVERQKERRERFRKAA